MRELTDGDEHLLAILPRSHAKTTIVSKAFVLWLVCTTRRNFIALFSNTDAQVTAILLDIRRNLHNNERIKALYGSLLVGDEVRENDHEIVTANGVCVRVAGSGVETLGWTHGPYRPELIIGDDLESRDTVATKAQRDKLEQWWDADVMPMRDLRTFRAVIIGTMKHQDCVLARKRRKGAYAVFFRTALIKDADAVGLWEQWEREWERGGKFAARAYYSQHQADMDAGAEVLWPDGMPYVSLREKRREVGPFAFQTEYQNEPVPPESTVIKAEWLEPRPQFIDGPDARIIDQGETIKLADCALYGSADLAISTADGADYFVLATGARTSDGRIYLIEAIRDRLTAPQQVRAILAAHDKWSYEHVAIESVAYQKALKQMVDEAGAKTGHYVPTKAVTPDKDKLRRLVRWQSIFEQRLVRVCDTVPASCVDELTQFPLAAHDDVCDATSQLLDLVSYSSRYSGIVSL